MERLVINAQTGVVQTVALSQSEIDMLPRPTPTPVPQRVSRRQGRLALIDVGKLAEVEAAIVAIVDPIEQMKAQVEYEADTWERGNAFLQAMWAQLGGTESELDDLFVLAATK